MRVAFYAPMKSPTHGVPSGDRRMARLLVDAMGHAGHDVFLASTLRSYDGAGEPARQARIRDIGAAMADRFIQRTRHHPPDVWFTYHIYHKAPDWLGPRIAAALAIPYVIAEASHAPKRAGGPWSIGFDGAAHAIATADAVIALNHTDQACVSPLMKETARPISLKPFIDVAAFGRQGHEAEALRRHYAIADDVPVLLCVAMMRADVKSQSYRVLGQALERLKDPPWHLFVVGDGDARDAVKASLGAVGDRVTWLGAQPIDALPALYAAADLFVWPAIDEAYGMVFLEAQAAGCPVVAGSTGGVAGVVEDGVSGHLTPVGDVDAFADAVGAMLDDPETRRLYGVNAADHMKRHHDISSAAPLLSEILNSVKRENNP